MAMTKSCMLGFSGMTLKLETLCFPFQKQIHESANQRRLSMWRSRAAKSAPWRNRRRPRISKLCFPISKCDCVDGGMRVLLVERCGMMSWRQSDCNLSFIVSSVLRQFWAWFDVIIDSWAIHSIPTHPDLLRQIPFGTRKAPRAVRDWLIAQPQSATELSMSRFVSFDFTHLLEAEAHLLHSSQCLGGFPQSTRFES